MNELLNILTDPAHLIAEVVLELASYLIFGVVFARMVLKRHDRKVHSDADPLFFCVHCAAFSVKRHQHDERREHEEGR